MLRNRVITALLLAPLAIVAILFLPANGFAVFWGAIILAAAWEWTHLSGVEKLPGRIGFVGLVAVFLLAARHFAHDWAPGALPAWFYGPAAAWWFLCGMAFRSASGRLAGRQYPTAAKLVVGAFVLITAWILMVWLRLNFGQYQVLYLVVLIWLADVAAYFVGKRWGHTKLLEAISPGKTVEGVYGALFAVALLAIAIGVALGFEPIMIGDFVFLSLLTVLISICGDLFESLMKRVRGVKDSSAILPGHGGVLDRIDSLLAGVSIFYAGSLLLGIFLQAPSAVPVELGADQPIPMEEQLGPTEESDPEGEAIPPDQEYPEHEHEQSPQETP